MVDGEKIAALEKELAEVKSGLAQLVATIQNTKFVTKENFLGHLQAGLRDMKTRGLL